MRRKNPLIFWALIVVPLFVLGLCRSNPNQIISVDGFEREYILYVPSAYDGTTPYPLVFALHGGLGDGGMMYRSTSFKELADKEQFIVVYPSGLKRGWSDGRGVNSSAADGVDDVAFLVALLDHIEAQYNIDPNRVYTTGISNGGFMSQRLLCDASDRFTAGVIVTAAMTTFLHETCHPSEPVAIMYINGTDDPAVPYDGGMVVSDRGEVISTDNSVNWWVEANNCEAEPAETSTLDDDPNDKTSIETSVYSDCDAGMDVVLLKVVGGGHHWPGDVQYLPKSIIGIPTKEIRGAETAWEFMKTYSK